MAQHTRKTASYYAICTQNAVQIQFRFLSATPTQNYVTLVCCGKVGEYKSRQIHGNIVTCSVQFLRDQTTTTTMNKAVILLGTACLVAIAIVQVSAQFGGFGLTGGFGYPSATGGAGSRSYYDNYYQQYERYNRAQAARTIANTVNGLQTSSLIGLFSLFGLAMIATNTTGTIAG